jgi:hypothetical protein
MLNINFSLENPFGNKFKNLGGLSKTLTKNKALELQHCYDASTLIRFEFDYSIKRDHAGLQINFALFGYTVYFQIYDTRHWDYNNNQWITYA